MPGTNAGYIYWEWDDDKKEQDDAAKRASGPEKDNKPKLAAKNVVPSPVIDLTFLENEGTAKGAEDAEVGEDAEGAVGGEDAEGAVGGDDAKGAVGGEDAEGAVGGVDAEAVFLEDSEEDEYEEPSRDLSDFLFELETCIPLMPDDVTLHFLEICGYQPDDRRVVRMISLATQKYFSDVITNSVKRCKLRRNLEALMNSPKKNKKPKPKGPEYVLTMQDIRPLLKRADYDELL